MVLNSDFHNGKCKKVTIATLEDTPQPAIISSYEERIDYREAMNRKRIWIWEALETEIWDYNKGLLYLPCPHPLSPMRQWGAMMSYGYWDLFMSSKYSSWAQCCLRGGWKGELMLKMLPTKFVMELLLKCHTKPLRTNNKDIRRLSTSCLTSISYNVIYNVTWLVILDN